jgi:hypothetical protein
VPAVQAVRPAARSEALRTRAAGEAAAAAGATAGAAGAAGAGAAVTHGA